MTSNISVSLTAGMIPQAWFRLRLKRPAVLHFKNEFTASLFRTVYS